MSTKKIAVTKKRSNKKCRNSEHSLCLAALHGTPSTDTENISQTSCCILCTNSELFYEYIDINNVIDLPYKNEEKVVGFMKSRYARKEFYTWAGQTLICVHPYEERKIYNEQSIEKPSIDALVFKAWFRIQQRLGKSNQAVVISGESGSGKTYSACLALKYIAGKEQEYEGNPFENVLWQAWSSVPLLSAFGNAATGYNHNSSRFGKFLQLQYMNGSIKGAFVQTYLLEKSRVSGPGEKEGNFHIFRQILDSLDEETLSLLCLDKSVRYKIAPGVNAKSTYTETVKALEILNITELDKILIVLAVILNMGNVDFELTGEAYTVSAVSYEFVKNVANLLHVRTKSLSDVLTTVQFSTKNPSRRNTVYKSHCMNKEECEERRNCVMKFLYDKLFSWLVSCVNQRTYTEGNHKLLGILDVYGFEVFDHNSFEQLCINYANERLQQYFVSNYLLEKRHELLQMGLEVEKIDDADYARRVALIDGPVSIFGILNEECAVKRFNNDYFISTRLTETLRGREHFIGSLNDLNTCFSIKHFAGVVKYDTKTMLYKNRDKVPEDIINFLKESNFDFLQHIMSYETGTTQNGKTLVMNFKKSLDTLMKNLDQADVHYVKCLKPNPYKIAEFFDDDYFNLQLSTNGIYEIMKLHFQKYSIKLKFEEFILQFSVGIFNNLQRVLSEEFHVSGSYIYLTEKAYFTFQKMKRIRRSIQARKVQMRWLRFHNERKRAAIIIQRCFRRMILRRSVSHYEKFIDLSKKSSDMCICRKEENRNFVCTSNKIEQYLKKHRFDVNFEGDRLSLILERVYNNLVTKPFKRVLFCGDRIVSYNRLAEVPVRFHTSKTCIRYSYLLPKSELPSGLPDIF